MTVRKDEPMNNLAARDDEFDALLDASSLGAPHVVAVIGNIPATARLRMAQAVRQQQRTLDDTASHDDTSQHDQADDVSTACSDPRSTSAKDTRTDHSAAPVDTKPSIIVGRIGAGKSSIFAALYAFFRAFDHERLHRPPAWQLCPGSVNQDRDARWPGMARHLLETSRPLTAYSGTKSFLTGDPSFSIRLISFCGLANGGDAWLQWAASPAERRPVSALLALTGPKTVYELLTSVQVPSGPLTGRVQDLRQFVRPTVEPISSPVVSPVPSAVPAPLHVARFADSAYKRTSTGLMLPALGEIALQHQQLTTWQDCGETSPVTRQKARRPSAETRLWATTTEGGRVQHAEMPMQIHQEEQQALTQTMRTRLIYRASDPYAVEARFGAEQSDETVWTFARELLRNGLERSAGQGDVIVWPGTEPSGQRRLFIRLNSPEGTALLSAADIDVRLFVEAAGDLVEYGAEHTHVAPALEALETAIGELTRPGTRE